MSVFVFDQGDADYLRWIADHPRGYVINTKRLPHQAVCMLHRSDCPHIRSLRNGDAQGSFTERGWIKLCSLDLRELIAELPRRKSAPLINVTHCKACNVLSQEIVIERHALQPPPHEVNTLSMTVDALEHDPLARARCIERYGASCAVCNLDMGMRYGQLGEGFIEVHHQYRSTTPWTPEDGDPVRDLVPVCPNCHAMLHRGRELPLTVQELKRAMQRVVARRNDMLEY